MIIVIVIINYPSHQSVIVTMDHNHRYYSHCCQIIIMIMEYHDYPWLIINYHLYYNYNYHHY